MRTCVASRSSTVTGLVGVVLLLVAGAGPQAGQLVVDAGRGPVTVHVPSSYDGSAPYPLVLLLHGYTSSGTQQESYFQLAPLAETRRFLYAHPDGTLDAFGNRFWNATDACCNLFGSSVDDSAYLLALVEAIRDELEVDPWRIHASGHSNGGFMSYRLACDHADVFAAIGSLAGATWDDPADCDPLTPVHVLQVHGTSDNVIRYDGGAIGQNAYPGAIETVESWASYDGCALAPDLSLPNRDVSSSIAGAESTVRRYASGCAPSGSAELWTIPGGGHSPPLADGFRTGLVEFLLGHRRAGLVFEDAQTLAWAPVRWAVRYRVYRGELGDLVDTDGDGLPRVGYGACISGGEPDQADTRLVDAELPPPGVGWFYLMGFGEGGGTESVLGTTSAGLARLPAVSCP